ncbi:MAG: hypothetical protein V9E94_06320 [Microthrixaceae bacterium]
MMAHRNVDVDDLNRRARSHLAEAHQLQGETLVVNERPFQIGDTVVCLRNDHQRKIRNGTVGEIVTIDHENRSVLLDTADGLRRLHQEYLDEGWMRHGYAVTVHKAQGLTCEHGLLLASDEMGYVGLSRGTGLEQDLRGLGQALRPRSRPALRALDRQRTRAAQACRRLAVGERRQGPCRHRNGRG